MLNNIVDNLEQCGQQNIVQCCFHQARTGCSFFAVLAAAGAVWFDFIAFHMPGFSAIFGYCDFLDCPWQYIQCNLSAVNFMFLCSH